MTENNETNKAIARFENLVRQRRELLGLTPEKALDAILNAPSPAALVHSFPEEDFYFLIHDIGIEDSLALLSLASNRQWEYIIDIEAWQKDRIDIRSATRWLNLLLKVDRARFIKWFVYDKTNLMANYLCKNIEVRIRTSDQDPSEFSQDFFTLDDTIYTRFHDDVFEPDSDGLEPDKIIKEHRDAFLTNFFSHLAEYHLGVYQNVLIASSGVILAETEEENYRRRNVRLAEKGVIPFDEAIGIYQPLSRQNFGKLSVKHTTADADRRMLLPVPLYATGMLPRENLFAWALQTIEIDDVLQQVQMEFAGLCNQVVSADQKTIRNREALRDIVKKVCGYINVGLEHLAVKGAEIDVNKAAALVKKYALSGIFRVGYGRALELKWRAEKWLKTSWFEGQGLLINFWGEDWMGILGGLLIKKPLFYDNYETGVLYREFASTADIDKAAGVLDQIIAVDQILALMTVEVIPVSDGLITHKNFLLTLWARHYLGLSEEPAPLTLDEFKHFFDTIWDSSGKFRKTRLVMKASFLNWLADQSGLADYEISQRLGHTLENLFVEVETEMGQVAKKDLDPRFINLFLMALENG